MVFRLFATDAIKPYAALKRFKGSVLDGGRDIASPVKPSGARVTGAVRAVRTAQPLTISISQRPLRAP